MTVSVQLNGTALTPQPASVDWRTEPIQQKLNGTDAIGSYDIAILRAPVGQGGTANWNWSSFENTVLTSAVLPARYLTMRDTGTTYSSGVVARKVTLANAPPGGLVRDVVMEVAIVV